MSGNNTGSTRDFMNLFYEVEHEMASWKYYKAINGKSVVATLFFFFLKYVDDWYFRGDKDDELSIYCVLRKQLLEEGAVKDNIVYDFLSKTIGKWGDGGEIVLQYVKWINFHELPKEFSCIIEWFGKYDFRDIETRENLVYAISVHYASLYSELTFRHQSVNNDIYAMVTAAEILNCKDGMSIYDFSCGTGGSLALCATENCKIYAQERNFEKAVIAYMYLKMSMAPSVYIEVGNVLETPMTRNYPDLKFDRIICVPPLKRAYKNEKIDRHDYLQEFEYSFLLSKSEFWGYARHLIKKLKDGGRGILVAPISVLSKEGPTKNDRKLMAKDGVIHSVIQLPTVISSTSAKLCMIIFEKQSNLGEINGIFFADFANRKSENIILSKDNSVNVDYKRIAEIVNKMENIDGISRIVSLKEVFDNELNFTPAIYFRNMTEMMERRENTVTILEQQKDLLNAYHESERKLDAAILNYYQLWGEKHNRRRIE